MAKQAKKYSFDDHPEHKAQLGAWTDRWIGIALRTQPQTDTDREACRIALRGLYAAANIEAPPVHREVFCASPITAAIAAVIAACVWWLREHPEKHAELFGRAIPEAEIINAIVPTVAIAVRAAHGLPVVGPSIHTAIRAAIYGAANDAATAGAIDTAPGAALGDATRAVVSDATRAEVTGAAIRAGVDACVDAATTDAINSMIRAINNATRASIDEATSAAVHATGEPTYVAAIGIIADTIYAVTHNAVITAAIDAALAAALAAATTHHATRAAVDAATIAAVDTVTLAEVDTATYASIDEATRAAVDAATDDATFAATHDTIYAATNTATAMTSPIVAFMLSALPKWSYMRNGSNQWAGWASYLSFFRVIAGLKLDEYAKWIHFENAAIHGGPRFMHARFWIVSDFPTRVCRDEYEPHSASGPALAWSDGWSIYYWRGTKVPREWIESPSTIDPTLALTHPNIEQRRCLAEILGWDKILSLLDAKTIDMDDDPNIGELIEVDLPDVGRERFLRVICGTGRRFAIPVPPATQTAIGAQAWIHQLDETMMRALEIRT